MTKLSGVLFLVIGLFIFSCSFDNKIEQTGPQNLEELEIPDGFNWDFTKDVNVNITARDANGALVEGVSVSLYKSESNLVFDLPTNEYGNINTDITMQESADFAIVNYQGNSITVPVNGNSIDCDLTVEPVRDIRASGTIYYPAENSVSTVMFEDMWPNKSDYDFNDMVVETWSELVYTDDYITQITLNAKLIASGARLHNGFS